MCDPCIGPAHSNEMKTVSMGGTAMSEGTDVLYFPNTEDRTELEY